MDQANAVNKPSPIAVPTASNQTTVQPPVNAQGLTVQQMSAAAGGPISPQQTIQNAVNAPGTLQTGPQTGMTPNNGAIAPTPTNFQAITGSGQVQDQGFLDLQKQRDAQAAQSLKNQQATLNQASQIPVTQVYNPATGQWMAPPTPNIQPIMSSSDKAVLANMTSSGGILTTTNYDSAAATLNSAIQTAKNTSLSNDPTMTAMDNYTQAIIQKNMQDAQNYQAWADNPNLDPQFKLISQKNEFLAQQKAAQEANIQTQADAQLKQREKLNSQLLGQAKAAENAAGQVGSMVGESYIAGQLQSNQDALESIKAAERDAIQQAETAYTQGELELAGEQMDIAEKRRSQASDINDKNVSLIQAFQQSQMQRQQIAQQAILTEQQIRANGRSAASDFLSVYSKQNLSPDVIPQSVWNQAVTESEGSLDINGAKAVYMGSLKDQQAKTAQAFSDNTVAFYKAAAQIKDPNAILNRPNQDGTFTQVKRSEIQTVPNYDTFQTTKDGKNYAVYVNKDDPTAKPTEVEIGKVDPKTTYKDNMWGGTDALIDNGDGTFTTKHVLDTAGNPVVNQSVLQTQNFLNDQGHPVTSFNPTDVSSNIGDLSSRFESNGNPGAIGYDSTGGASYGTYQLAHDNALKFVENSSYASAFQGLQFNSPEWQKKWKEVAKQDPQNFAQAQKDYIERTHFGPQVNLLQKFGIDPSGYSQTVQDVIWSTCVQMGPNTQVCKNAIKNVGKDASEEDIIKEIYKERWNDGKNFASSTPDVKKSVYNRFFGPNGEEATALKQLRAQQTDVPKDNAMAWAIQAPENAPVLTHIQNGIVQSVEQVGSGANNKPMMMVTVKDTDTGTIHRFSGMNYSSLQDGMAWGSSEKAPQIGASGSNGYSQAIYNHDGSPVKPVGQNAIPLSQRVSQGETWGQYDFIPPSPQVQSRFNTIMGQAAKGTISLDSALSRMKTDPILGQIKPETYMGDLQDAAQQGTLAKTRNQSLLDQTEQRTKASKAMTAQRILNLMPDYKVQQEKGVIAKAVVAENVQRDINAAMNNGDDAMLIDAISRYQNAGGAVTEGQLQLLQKLQTPWDQLEVLKQQANGVRSFLSPGQKQALVNATNEGIQTTMNQYQQYTGGLQQVLQQNGSDFQIPSSPLSLQIELGAANQSGGQDISAYQSQLQPGEMLMQDGQGNYVAVGVNDDMTGLTPVN